MHRALIWLGPVVRRLVKNQEFRNALLSVIVAYVASRYSRMSERPG